MRRTDDPSRRPARGLVSLGTFDIAPNGETFSAWRCPVRAVLAPLGKLNEAGCDDRAV